MRSKFYISLGTNEGDRLYNILKGLILVGENFKVVGFSSIYITEPWGMEGRDFLNMCALLSTDMNPFDALYTLQNIERKMGRRYKGKPYRSRTLDLDILLWEGLSIKSEGLTVPHPLIRRRDFVNIPIKEMFKSGFPTLGYKPVIVGDIRVLKVVDRRAIKVG